jgi:hypothetical protein
MTSVELSKHSDNLAEIIIFHSFSLHRSLYDFLEEYEPLMLGLKLIASLHICHNLHLGSLKPFIMKYPINFSRIKTNQAVNESFLISKQLVEVFERYKNLVGARSSLSSSATTDLNLL